MYVEYMSYYWKFTTFVWNHVTNHFARNGHSRILFLCFIFPPHSHLLPPVFLSHAMHHPFSPLLPSPSSNLPSILSISLPSPSYPFSYPFSIHLLLLPPSSIPHLPASFPFYSFMLPPSSSLPTSIFHSYSLSTSMFLFYVLHTCQQVVQGREGGRGESEDGREQSLQAVQTLHEKQ